MDADTSCCGLYVGSSSKKSGSSSNQLLGSSQHEQRSAVEGNMGDTWLLVIPALRL